MQQADCLLVSVGLWPFCLLGTVVETGRGNGSGLLFSGEVVMEGDRGMEGREPTPCSVPLAALMLLLICLVTTSLV